MEKNRTGAKKNTIHRATISARGTSVIIQSISFFFCWFLLFIFFPFCVIRIRCIECNKLAEIVYFYDILCLHWPDAKLILFRVAEHCHIVPVNLTVFLYFKLLLQMAF